MINTVNMTITTTDPIVIVQLMIVIISEKLYPLVDGVVVEEVVVSEVPGPEGVVGIIGGTGG
jgi:hypothetical protein